MAAEAAEEDNTASLKRLLWILRRVPRGYAVYIPRKAEGMQERKNICSNPTGRFISGHNRLHHRRSKRTADCRMSNIELRSSELHDSAVRYSAICGSPSGARSETTLPCASGAAGCRARPRVAPPVVRPDARSARIGPAGGPRTPPSAVAEHCPAISCVGRGRMLPPWPLTDRCEDPRGGHRDSLGTADSLGSG